MTLSVFAIAPLLLGMSFAFFAFLLFVIALPASIVGLLLTLILTHHKRKMEELKMQRQVMMNDQVRAELTAIRTEIQSLRDTSMQYDLSFDTTLQQVERRLSFLERQSHATPPVVQPLPGRLDTGGYSPGASAPEEQTVQPLYGGRG